MAVSVGGITLTWIRRLVLLAGVLVLGLAALATPVSAAGPGAGAHHRHGHGWRHSSFLCIDPVEGGPAGCLPLHFPPAEG